MADDWNGRRGQPARASRFCFAEKRCKNFLLPVFRHHAVLRHRAPLRTAYPERVTVLLSGMKERFSRIRKQTSPPSGTMDYVCIMYSSDPNRSSYFHSYTVLLSAGLYPGLSEMWLATPVKSRIRDDCGIAEEG